MSAEKSLETIAQQNEVIISLLARLAWTPEKLLAAVTIKKRNPDAYVRVYNALDGEQTGQQLAQLAGVTQQAMAAVLKFWLEEGLVANVGTETQPRYRRFMKLPERQKAKAKNVVAKEPTNP